LAAAASALAHTASGVRTTLTAQGATLSAAVTKQRADNASVQVRTQPDV